MKRFCLLLIAALAMSTSAQNLKTRWAEGVTPENVHREYPRPQMVRKDWVNLNGLWNLQLSWGNPGGGHQAIHPVHKVLIPFPVESQLSGVEHLYVYTRDPKQEYLVYSRVFERPKGERVLLHFGAVDWKANVFVNGISVGDHTGGYDPFSFDITDSLSDSGPQTLEVWVQDPTDTGHQPRGKQVNKPGGIFYTPCSGIWQTVWLEPVHATYISGLKILAHPRAGQVDVTVTVNQNQVNYSKTWRCRVEVLDGGKVIAQTESEMPHGEALPEAPGRDPYPTTYTLKIPNHQDWSPENPKLYDLRVMITSLDPNYPVKDQVTSYFGFREVSLIKNAAGQPVLALNGKPYFFFGPLDQGFWPDGIYTAPTDEAMKYDIEETKRLGFNMIRKHVKVEPDRWYYWCDKLGIAVFQDMPSGDKSIGPDDPDLVRTKQSADDYMAELQAMIDTHFNHPSIVAWVPFNEGWGQWNTAGVTDWIRSHDPSRFIDSTTGWTDRGVGDMYDIHDYPGPGMPHADPKRALLLGEFGGLGLPVAGHMWLEKGWGYQSFKTSEELTDRFVELLAKLREFRKLGLSGAVYTQTTDVETELNGLMTYDRAMIKMDEKRVRKAIEELLKD